MPAFMGNSILTQAPGGFNTSPRRSNIKPRQTLERQAGLVFQDSNRVKGPVHRSSGLVTERNLNVSGSTLRVGHLTRGLSAVVTTARYHSTGPPPFSVMPQS